MRRTTDVELHALFVEALAELQVENYGQAVGLLDEGSPAPVPSGRALVTA
jgi:hypothetical protein